MSVPVILAVHVEPVERLVRATNNGWPGFQPLVDLLMERRASLEQATGRPVFFNWCLRADPQIEIAFGDAGWVFDHYGDEIERIVTAGDSIGMHIHFWKRERRFFRDTWVAEFKDEDWIRRCMKLGTETFRKRLGYVPPSLSIGDHFMHECLLPIISDCGIRVDYSMSPGMKPHQVLAKGERSHGAAPDYSATPRKPFKPSGADFRVPGPSNHAFWEVPVTSGIIGKQKDGTDRWMNLLLGTNPDWVSTIVDQALTRPQPYIFAECRTDVLTHPKTQARFLWALDHFAELSRSHDLEFVRLETFADRLDQEALSVPA